MTGCDEWPIAWTCPTDGIASELLDAAQSLAGQLLWALSGYRVGACSYGEAFRPANAGQCGYPYKDANGNWRNNGRAGGSCCRVLLSHRPVRSITEVVVNDIVLDPAEYALEGSWLRSRNGCWPMVGECDDPALIVVYRAGVGFPAGTAGAVGEVACEYLTALQGGPCRLPSRATSITRQGVTVTLDTAADFVARGRIGLPITDAWLESVVGVGPRVPSRVYSPDLPRGIPAATSTLTIRRWATRGGTMLSVNVALTATSSGALVLSRPTALDLDIYRGDTGSFAVTVTNPDGTPLDVSTAVWSCQVRAAVDDPTPIAELNVMPAAGEPSKVNVILDADTSEGLASGVWDLQMVLGSAVVTLLGGKVKVTKDVSRV